MNIKKKKNLINQILIFAVSLTLLGASYRNIDNYEATESRGSKDIRIYPTKFKNLILNEPYNTEMYQNHNTGIVSLIVSYKTYLFQRVASKFSLLLDGYPELKNSNIVNSGELYKDVNSFTQSDEFFHSLFQKTLENLNTSCHESALVNYQSQKLVSPDEQKSIAFEVTMQRPASTRKIGKYCSSSGRQTLIRSMLVEDAGKVFNLNSANLGYISLYKSYFVINPISFSPDSRFLISRMDSLATITDYFRVYAIFDFQNNYHYLKLSPCKDDQFGGIYYTFTSNTEVVFKCDVETQSPYLEVINLQNLSIRRVSISSLKLPDHSLSFGSISQEFTLKP